MKKLTRIGIVVLIIGASLLFVTILRGSSPTNIGGGGEDAPADKWTLHPACLFPPKDVIVEVNANATIDVYILDANGIKQWESDGTLEPRWTFEGIKQDKFTLPITERGTYAILTHNIQNLPTAIQVSLTFSGYERDLLWASVAFIVTGIILAIVSLVKSWRPQAAIRRSSPKIVNNSPNQKVAKFDYSKFDSKAT